MSPCTKKPTFSPPDTVPAVAGLLLLLTLTFADPAGADDAAFGFASGMGGSYNESGRGIALDALGNVYTTGRFTGTADFDPGPGTENLVSAGGEFDEDVFVSKLDAAGNFVWARSMGGPGFDEGLAVAVDASGNVYITGRFTGTADFDPGAGAENLVSAGGEFDDDVFVSKLNSAGNFVWARSMGGTGFDEGLGIALDASRNVYTTGTFTGTADFKPGAGKANLTSAGGEFDEDIFVSRLDSAGNYVWAKSMGGSGLDEGLGIALDPSGNVYTTGSFRATADFNPGAGTANLSSAGDEDVFVSKLNAAGSYVWARSMGGMSSALGSDIAADASGNVYTTGSFLDTADFNPGTGTANLTSAGTWDIFVSKLDSAGDFAWAKRLGGTSSDSGFGIALDTSDNVYTTGRFSGTVDFDPGAGTENLTTVVSIPDIFISRLDSAGNFVWAKQMGGGGFDVGLDIVLDTSDNVYTTGNFQDVADFDPGAGTENLTSADGLDTFVSKLTRTGSMAETWVDFGFLGSEDGSESNPFNTLAEGLAETAPSGTVKIKGNTGDSVSNETTTIGRPVTIRAVGGTVRIGGLGGRSPDNGRQWGFVSRDWTRLNGSPTGI